MTSAQKKKPKKILVIDVGGTHIKVRATGHTERRKFDSSRKLTPQQMVRGVKRITRDWQYYSVSIGCPGPIISGKLITDPRNLGKGWVGFDFQKAFGCPVKLVNDAEMQALGSYHGGRMLFLGLGTGLGSAMIVEGVSMPMELAHLPYKKGKTYEDYLGLRGLRRLGKKKWRKHVADVVQRLTAALEPDYVVLGGGNVKELKELPPKTEPGANENAFQGGFRLWNA
jgi:predicted NBD/HSP70 family sugar kinase